MEPKHHLVEAGKETRFKKGKVRSGKVTPEIMGRRYNLLIYRWMGFVLRAGEEVDPKVLQAVLQAAGDRCKALGQVQAPAPPDASGGKEDAIGEQVKAALAEAKARKGV